MISGRGWRLGAFAVLLLFLNLYAGPAAAATYELTELWSHTIPGAEVTAVALSSTGDYVAAGTDGNTLYLFTRAGVEAWNHSLSSFTTDPVNGTGFADGTHLYAFSNSTLYLYGIDGSLIGTFTNASTEPILAAKATVSGNLVAYVTPTYLFLRNISTGDLMGSWQPHAGTSYKWRDVAIKEDGSTVYGLTSSGAIEAYSFVVLSSTSFVPTPPTLPAYLCGSYTCQNWTTSGNWTTPAGTADVYYLVIAGGGGGSGSSGGTVSGGGGAGGFRTNNFGTPLPVSGSYIITVGAGGSGAVGQATNGSRSIFSSNTSEGGGAGGLAGGLAGGSGGGGHGGGGAVTGGAGNTPPTTPSQGNNGGVGVTAPKYLGGGGGGANTTGRDAGVDGGGKMAGSGGYGFISNITGSDVWYAGGGGGASDSGIYAGALPGIGGLGGGGNGGDNTVGTSATANTGGGGGAGGSTSAGIYSGGNGGSGFVALKYLDGTTITTHLPAFNYSASKTGITNAQNMDLDNTEKWFSVSATAAWYGQQVDGITFGTQYTYASGSGAPTARTAISGAGSFSVEGRGAGIFDVIRLDGTRVGTYTAGGTINGVAVSDNGLWAVAGSNDGIFYAFGKQSSSSWQLIDTSTPVAEVLAVDLLGDGSIGAAGRSDGTLTLYQVGEATTGGFFQLLHFTKDGSPAVGYSVKVEEGGVAGTTYMVILTSPTDSNGDLVFAATSGHYYRITVDGQVSIIQASSSYPTLYLSWVSPPAYPTWGSGFNVTNGTIDTFYQDPIIVPITVEIKNTDTRTLAFCQTFTTDDLDLSWSPPSGTHHYQVRITADRPTGATGGVFYPTTGTGTTMELIPVQGPALQILLMIFLMVVAGLFGYVHAPVGALGVSVIAVWFNYMNWLTIPWYWVQLTVLVAFMAMLARGADV